MLHVNDFPLSFGGGAEVVIARTLGLLEEAGWQTRLFSSADLPDSRLTARRYISNPIAQHALSRTIAEWRPDVVHLHNYYHQLSPGILATLAHVRRTAPIRVVMTAHDFHLACPNAGGTWFPRGGGRTPLDPVRYRDWSYLLTRRWDHRGRLHSWLRLAQHAWNYRWLQRQRVLDCVASPSAFLEDLLRPLVRKTCTIPHPAPKWVSAPVAERPATLHWLFVGRLEPEKGLGEWLTLLPDDFPGNVTVIGDGADRGRCEAIVSARGWAERVRFRGRIPHAEVAGAMASAHVLVLPSLVPESYGLVLAEALSLGTNVLAADLGGSREMIGAARVGYLFEPGNGDALRSRVAAIAEAFREGSLNRFEVGEFFAARSETRYRERILEMYAE